VVFVRFSQATREIAAADDGSVSAISDTAVAVRAAIVDARLNRRVDRWAM
jgi:hypothetical protein